MIRVFSHWVQPATIIGIVSDFAFILLGIGIAFAWVGHGLPVELDAVVIYSLVLAVTMLMLNASLGFYHRVQTHSFSQTRARAVLTLHLSIPIAYGLYLLLLPDTTINKQFLQLAVMGAVFGMLANRLRAYHMPPPQIMMSRVLIFGCGDKALEVTKIITKSDRYVEIVGYVPAPGDKPAVPPEQIINSDGSLAMTARKHDVDEIIIAITERRGGAMPLRELLDCKLYGVRVLDLPTHFEQFLGQIRLDSLKASYLIFGTGFRQTFLRNAVKRVFDIVCSLILLVLAAPLMLIAAIAIILENGFPIFYLQERIGLDSKPFKVIKFRSMRTDAEKDGPKWATSGDSRVTRVGKIIRKIRVDELPQVISVLKGDMSLVGPRPERQHFIDKLTPVIPFYAVRHSVKPGVTGWAQVRYPYGASIEDAAQKLQYDLYYVKNHTLFLDMVILFETVGVVLSGKGAQ